MVSTTLTVKPSARYLACSRSCAAVGTSPGRLHSVKVMAAARSLLRALAQGSLRHIPCPNFLRRQPRRIGTIGSMPWRSMRSGTRAPTRRHELQAQATIGLHMLAVAASTAFSRTGFAALTERPPDLDQVLGLEDRVVERVVVMADARVGRDARPQAAVRAHAAVIPELPRHIDAARRVGVCSTALSKPGSLPQMRMSLVGPQVASQSAKMRRPSTSELRAIRGLAHRVALLQPPGHGAGVHHETLLHCRSRGRAWRRSVRRALCSGGCGRQWCLPPSSLNSTRTSPR
jgi:hypothetical protein